MRLVQRSGAACRKSGTEQYTKWPVPRTSVPCGSPCRAQVACAAGVGGRVRGRPGVDTQCVPAAAVAELYTTWRVMCTWVPCAAPCGVQVACEET
eukprot:6618-Chlamydomonas_euryale.AAC.1